MASAKERVRDCGEVGGPQTENVTRVNNQQVCGLVLQFVYICGLKKGFLWELSSLKIRKRVCRVFANSGGGS